MAKAGWYPDPGGQAGLYRFWDGRAWSAGTSTNPSAAPPSQPLGAPTQPGAGSYDQAYGQGYGQGQGQSQGYGTTPTSGPGGRESYSQSFGQQGRQAYGPGQPGRPGSAYESYRQGTTKRRLWPWWVGIGAVVAVVAVVVVLVVRGVTGGGVFGSPSGQGTANLCPSIPSSSITPGNSTSDGRVHGGPVSYPLLGSPWSAPESDDRVPFGSDVLSQIITIEPNYDGLHSWVASVLIGQLLAGDGFYSPEDGSKIVTKCIVGAFYDDAVVTRHDTENKAIKVDGHDAWIVRSHLTFDIPKLRTKGETMIVVIVNAGVTSGLFYASIPDTSPQYLAPAEKALAGLTVD